MASANHSLPGLAVRLALVLSRRKPGAAQLLFMASLLFAVFLVNSMLLFTGRVERAIYRENATLLAADLQVESTRPFAAAELQDWLAQAGKQGLAHTQAVELASMLFFEGELLLSRVAALVAHDTSSR